MTRFKSPPPKPTSEYRANILREAMASTNVRVAELQAQIDGVTVSVSGKADESIEINTGEGLSGGGDLTANRTLVLDIDSLTADVSPDRASDYVATYDVSALGHKKVLLSELGASEINDLDDVEITSPAHNDVLTFVDQVFDFVLSGDMNTGSDQLLLSGDMQAGTDVIILSGDDRADESIWKNVPFSSLPL